MKSQFSSYLKYNSKKSEELKNTDWILDNSVLEDRINNLLLVVTNCLFEPEKADANTL